MRKERKYTFRIESLQELKEGLLLSTKCFREAYPTRFVNSIYLDSHNLLNLDENLAGLSKRYKARLRWYTSELIQDKFLSDHFTFEVKTKSNFFGGKKQHRVNLPNNISQMNSMDLNMFLRKNLPFDYLPFIDHCNEFPLGVSYKRSYYEDFQSKIRITLDSNLMYFKPCFQGVFNFRHTIPNYMNYGVLEVKYENDSDIEGNLFDSKLLNITAGRHSKYVVGTNIV